MEHLEEREREKKNKIFLEYKAKEFITYAYAFGNV